MMKKVANQAAKILGKLHTAGAGAKRIDLRNGGGDPDDKPDPADVLNPEIAPLCLWTNLNEDTAARSSRRYPDDSRDIGTGCRH